ncbi:MAG: GNAT family N-acetyltransferase [Bacteroidetes bacterium]|jgi:predicted GNAT family acetyltransferase|nr:GNAT family N-acetyltransferase [Bacteroidota bacterium]
MTVNDFQFTTTDSGGMFYLGDASDPDAYISYTTIDSNLISIDHTVVKPELGGQGIAKKLVKKIIDLAIGEKYKIIPVCSYASAFFEKNKEYQYLLAPEQGI